MTIQTKFRPDYFPAIEIILRGPILLQPNDLVFVKRTFLFSALQSRAKIIRIAAASPIWYNRESRDDLTPFCESSCVGVECAGAGAGAGNAEIRDLFAILGEELDAFLLDIGVVWLTFLGVGSDSGLPTICAYFFPLFSVCFRRKMCFSTAVLLVEIIVGLGICSSVISFTGRIATIRIIHACKKFTTWIVFNLKS